MKTKTDWAAVAILAGPYTALAICTAILFIEQVKTVPAFSRILGF